MQNTLESINSTMEHAEERTHESEDKNFDVYWSENNNNKSKKEWRKPT